MRDWDREQEAEFFRILDRYLDLERNTSRSYSPAEYSLERMPLLARVGGNPEEKLGIVHVAGTKGKGSTCHYLASLLAATGLHVGTFASPHLSTVRERFQIDGIPIDYESLLGQARKLVNGMEAHDLTPGFFEVLTVLALDLFVEASCKMAVMETGIGGRLDATNYVPRPLCTAITPISLDHTQLLGDTVAEIAAEKAGILKPGVPLVLGKQPFPEAEEIIRRKAASLDVPVETSVPVEEARTWLPRNTPEFLVENFGIALRVCQLLDLVPRKDDFHPPQPRGRFEIIRQSPLVLLDAAHNADSARRLVQAVGQHFPHLRWTAVLGVVKGKDIEGIVRELAALDADFILTNPRPPKISGLEELVKAAEAAGLSHSVQPEITSPDDLPGDAPLLFTGSFFTALIGEELYSQRTPK
jgi:dihydrofolate synthase/folylpolyglutamate synthase